MKEYSKSLIIEDIDNLKYELRLLKITSALVRLYVRIVNDNDNSITTKYSALNNCYDIVLVRYKIIL